MPPSKKVSNMNRIGQVFNKLLNDIGEAEEFSLPDWSNEGKPTPYTLIKRNIYLTEKTKKKVEDDGIFCSCALSHGSSSVVCGGDCHCGMLYSSCSSSCNCGSECSNKPFQQRRVKKLKLTQTEKCGSGIVAEEYIQEGEFIIEYVGEVIDDETCGDRLWKMKNHGETNFYLCEISKNMVIDATNKGNKSRYINHSCNPNTQMQKWIIEGETRIGIFAISDINKGDHITYDYQFVQFGPDQDCHCGAISCRKKLGVKPKKPKLASDEVLNIVNSELGQTSTFPQVHQNEGILEGTLINKLSEEQTCPRNCIGVVIRLSRPTSDRCFGIIRRFHEVTRKHSVMFEDGVTEFIDLSKEDWEILSD
ncbi:Histone-lysine N-methyltransferase ASHH3 [Raphanus sativus]|uniref:Histone-lysine N-methyltransferase ASHH3-like n=1 Tax=Raphanus sativus TaxID=3726 RepID=A0A9W3DCH2_RAPSA|nr:histone-lysine N-methyltransferase ASHH3-like [Raphanus sativus]XP_056861448.1 histone-lysine N-methyltransferase ASHH3-like [Raphanus sativus]KAJ4906488.1 Histone-lysine N-methyltransferase ASHH3 [Raphanus sativus]